MMPNQVSILRQSHVVITAMLYTQKLLKTQHNVHECH